MVAAPKTAEDFAALQIGDAWRPLDDRAGNRWLEVAPKHAGKAALLVKLPCGTYFNVYGTGWDANGPTAFAWEVVGVPPALTLTPSVDVAGGWHGHIHGGIITADVSGKTF